MWYVYEQHYCSTILTSHLLLCLLLLASAALDLVVTAQALFRLACAHYLLTNYTEALEFILQANNIERYNPHIENVLLVILLRLRSRKDRADAIEIE